MDDDAKPAPATADRGFSAELEFLLALLKRRLQSEGEPPPWTAPRRPLDWPRWLDLCQWHRVECLAESALSAEAAESAPKDVVDALRRRRRAQAVRSVVNAGELRRVAGAFAARGIRFLTVKGVVLSRLAYGGIGLRHAGDIDLLAPGDRVSAARAGLTALGYQRVASDGVAFDDAGLTSRQASFLYRHQSHQRFVNRSNGALLELHWRLNWNEAVWPKSFEDLWERRRECDIAGESIPTLSEGDTLAYLASHGAKHAWFRLLWLFDIALLLRQSREADLRTLVDGAERMGVAPSLRAALALAGALFGSATPDMRWPGALERRLTRYPLSLLDRRIAPERRGVLESARHFRYRMGLIPSWRGRLREWEHLAISAHDFRSARLPDWLFPLYAARRPLSWARRRRQGPRPPGN